MQYTAQDIIKGAFKLLNITDKGETPDADEMSDALQSLNMMIDNWSVRSLLGTAYVKESFPLTANQSFTIGPTGVFVTSKPIKIMSAYYTDGSGTRFGLNVVNQEMFDGYADADIVNAQPDALYYDPGTTQQSNQVGTIYLYTTPDSNGTYKLHINSQKPFTGFTNLTDTFTFPPSYARAMKFNFAIEIASEYGAVVSREVLAIAQESLDDLEAVNAQQLVAGLDIPGTKGRSYNWMSDEAN